MASQPSQILFNERTFLFRVDGSTNLAKFLKTRMGPCASSENAGSLARLRFAQDKTPSARNDATTGRE
jgi:hypothetical protein